MLSQETIDAINLNAVNYWRRQSGPVALAEEIYHRLRRCEPAETLDQRWDNRAAHYLTDALEELAPPQRIWLSERLGITVTPDLRSEARLADWEGQTARFSERLIRDGNAEGALAAIRERPRKPGGPLHRLEMEALRLLHRSMEAFSLLLLKLPGLWRQATSRPQFSSGWGPQPQKRLPATLVMRSRTPRWLGGPRNGSMIGY